MQGMNVRRLKNMLSNLYRDLYCDRVYRKAYILINKTFFPRYLIFGDTNAKFFGPGWETVDRGNADHKIDLWRNPLQLPFTDGSIEVIYSSHLIEHLDNEACRRLFREWYRILKKGGVLRVVAPNMDYLIDSYLTDDKDAFFKDEMATGIGRTYYEEIAMQVYMYNYDRRLLEPHNLLASQFSGRKGYIVFDKQDIESNVRSMSKEEFTTWLASHNDPNLRGGHCNGWNSKKLIRFLKELHFSQVKESKFRQSVRNELNNNENIDLLIRSGRFSFYVECIK